MERTHVSDNVNLYFALYHRCRVLFCESTLLTVAQ